MHASQIDLTKLSFAELQALLKSAEAAVNDRKAVEIGEFTGKVQELAKAHGIDYSQWLATVAPATAAKKTSSKAGTAKGGKVLPKFKSAEGETWSGRGKRPKWVQAHLNQGGQMEDLEIGK